MNAFDRPHFTRHQALRRTLLTAGLAAPWLPSRAQSLKLSPPPFSESIDLSDKVLRLNGSGVRYRALSKLYAAALYLQHQIETPAQVVNSPGPKRLAGLLLRDFEWKELGQMLAQGLQRNSTGVEIARHGPEIARLGGLFAHPRLVQAGSIFWLDFLPGVGSVLSLNGQALGQPFQEATFFGLLMNIWLGSKPVDANLKEALLGRPAANPLRLSLRLR